MGRAMSEKTFGEETLLVSFLTQDEMDALIEDWDRYDVDQDACVTRAEFLDGERKWYKRVYGSDISVEELEDKFSFWKRTRDTDNSGEVSWSEFSESKSMLILDQRNALKDVLTAEEIAEAKKTFDRIDEDHMGTITQTEARKYFKKRQREMCRTI